MAASLLKLRHYLHRLRGCPVELDPTAYRKLLAEISRRDLRAVEDDQLRRMAGDLITKARSGVELDDLLVETYALVREASTRILGLHPFDVQILGALAMHQGKLVEMQTGEGKTLVAVFPACLSALTGGGVHVLTFNDYLARRDAEWMGPVYRSLGLSVGFVQEGMDRRQRQDAYAADVTYLTAKEAGFDFLRDHLCLRTEDLVHRAFHFAIVDEADSILIDEARVPLVIAGSTSTRQADPYRMAELVRRLDPETDFETDEYARNVHLTEAGLDRAEATLGCGNLHDSENLASLTELNLALHARALLRRDVDYIVRDDKVELVDEFTGRVVQNRRWPDGLQAAAEAKEEVPLQPQGMIRGSITLQHFLRMYPRFCGMTATAQPAAEEFDTLYGLKTVVIPPNRPCQRVDHPDVVFTHKEAKRKALVKHIARVHRTGRPILVGTSTVVESEQLAAGLKEAGIACRVLNAKNDRREARIIAQAGTLGAVTISTNMAGRGVDIRLGGDPPKGRDKVVALGGLYVIGTNRHESRRIDDQLRGRAGRQGDPGSSQFFISLEDDLIERYGVQKLIPSRHRPQPADQPVESRAIRREIERAQRIIQNQTSEIRSTLSRYSRDIEEQRRMIHRRRQDVLLGKTPLELLAARAPKRYSELRDTVGKEVLQDVERQLTLLHIDRGWTEHLAHVADIREGIHLVVVAGEDPLVEFHRRVGTAFRNTLERIDDAIVDSFRSVRITKQGIDLKREGLEGPSSTWTYLINDNPFGTWLERFFKGITRRLSKGSDR